MRSDDFGALVAEQLAAMLDELGGPALSPAEILGDERTRNRDLTELGLGSLDWMRLAVRIGNETGLELPQSALVDQGSRTVAGWARALAAVAEPGAPAR
ncbi:acyl carrier protein [Kitasatospora cineracea]|uniref:Phosphopantetheine binding protein n=1 Tax=Kitasatospora cineracea TaxID=88074 RepID=A0A3N4SB20_9ACTN|nr:acyl carrier protein [Kitasatospora cineracea]ROR43213.1 phosphopantetheine binding protein [Kitasatospora cineracea]RPE33584.1 phosphopantetheine binding protein [Kitasatospora cineracea]